MPPAIRPSHPQSHRSRPARHFALDVLQSAIQAFLLFLILSSLVGRFEIEQESMQPTFQEGQRVVVSQLGTALPGLHWSATVHAANAADTALDLRRGHVVVFHNSPLRDDVPLIKRLIALPGDTIEIRDQLVYVNGAQLDEPYIQGADTLCSTYCGPLTLGPGEYYFMGDNRQVSRDSRSFGPVPAEQVVGRVILRYWPLSDFSLEP